MCGACMTGGAVSTPPADDVRDGMAKAMCAVETRSKAATLEEVQSGIQRWTRHRYEAECLIAELADYGLEVRPRGTGIDAEVEWQYGVRHVDTYGFPVDRAHLSLERAQTDLDTCGMNCFIIRRRKIGDWVPFDAAREVHP